METLKQIIEKLEATRIEKNLSYDEVAKMIESSKSSIWKVLTGLSIPNGDTLLKLIDALEYDFKINKKEIKQKLSKEELKDFIDKNATKNNFSKQSIDTLKKVIKLPKEKTLPKTKKVKPEPKKEVTECPNCKYSETASGLRIKILKCNDCKTKKK